MRAVRAVLVAILLLNGCGATSSSLPSAIAPSSSAVPSVTGLPSPRPSVDGDPLSELLPLTVSGVPTVMLDTTVANRSSPRIFLKVVARLDRKPTDAEVALAFTPNSTLYALRIDGASGSDIAAAYLAEHGSSTPPLLSIGGKQVRRIGALAGGFLYGSDDVFFYVECPDEVTAAEVLEQLP